MRKSIAVKHDNFFIHIFSLFSYLFRDAPVHTFAAKADCRPVVDGPYAILGHVAYMGFEGGTGVCLLVPQGFVKAGVVIPGVRGNTFNFKVFPAIIRALSASA
jgi:hypothetical protein